MKTINEKSRDIPVYDECDILVVGGGPAGHSAAVAASRAGNKNVILLERYGFMGGLATGAYVIALPRLSCGDRFYVRGLHQEWIDRLKKKPNGVLIPPDEEVGSKDPAILDKWRGYIDTVQTGNYDGMEKKEGQGKGSVQDYLSATAYFEPTMLKLVMDEMIREENGNIRLCLHSFATTPIVENGVMKGVILESKEGRKAILAKVVIDATGDADIAWQTGAPYYNSDTDNAPPHTNKNGLVYRIGGADFKRFRDWQISNLEDYRKLKAEVNKIAGYRAVAMNTSQNDVVWVNNWVDKVSCIKIADLTRSEMEIRKTILDTVEFFKKNFVGFENAFLYDIAPVIGARRSRCIIGEYVMTRYDFAKELHHDDCIMWHSTIGLAPENFHRTQEFPYRAILPLRVENLLCPGKHMSADQYAIEGSFEIPQCAGTGQAAGVAAAVAVKNGTTVRNVNIKEVQHILKEQNVVLPDHVFAEKK